MILLSIEYDTREIVVRHDIRVNGIVCRPMFLALPTDTECTRKTATQYFRSIQDKGVTLEISHDPILGHPVYNMEQYIERQMLIDEDGDYYIDQFGFYVYAFSRLSETDKIIDNRY